MPLLTISICPRCKQKTCPGSVWEVSQTWDINMIPSYSPMQGQRRCFNQAFGGGSALKKLKVDDTKQGINSQIVRLYDNWVTPTYVAYRKVEA